MTVMTQAPARDLVAEYLMKELTGQEMLDIVLPVQKEVGIPLVRRELRKLYEAESDPTTRHLLYMAFTIVDFIEYAQAGRMSVAERLKRVKYLRLALASFRRHFGQMPEVGTL